MSTDVADAVAALRGPQHTLTISLEARGRASRWSRPIVADPEAERLTDLLALHTDLRGFPASGTVIGTAVRTELIDAEVHRFVAVHPTATVVTLGAGLCTRHVRLAGLDCAWVDVDLPEVAAIRSALLSATGERRVVPASVTDRAAIAELVGGFDGPTLLVLEGLAMYLAEDEVRDLLRGLAAAPDHSRIVLESVGAMAVRKSHKNRSLRASDARFRWATDDIAGVVAWDGRLCHRATRYLMDEHKRRWPVAFRVLRMLPVVRTQSKLGIFDVVRHDTSTGGTC